MSIMWEKLYMFSKRMCNFLCVLYNFWNNVRSMFEVITRPTEWLHSMSGFVVLKSQKFRDNTYTCNQQKLIDLKRINEQNQWTWNEFHVKNRFQNNPMIVETTNSHHPWKSLIVIWNHWASVNIISNKKNEMWQKSQLQ